MINLTVYNGYQIEIDVYGLFKATKGDVTLGEYNLGTLKEKIDRTITKQKKAEQKTKFPIEIIYSSWGDPYLGQITSMSDDGGVWVSYARLESGEKNRTKISSVDIGMKLFQATPSNKLIIEKYLAIQKEVSDLEGKQKQLVKGLADHFDASVLA